MFTPKNNTNKLEEISNRLTLYLKYTRYKAMIDNKYDPLNNVWHKQRWTLKFFRCRKDVGGLYYSIYSDNNNSGHPSAGESLKDTLTNKNIYSSNSCKETSTNSKYVLLTKNFDIKDVHLSCNSTTSLGQISFGHDGKIYTKLSNVENEYSQYELKEKCNLTLIDKYDRQNTIEVEPNTGYIKKN